MAKIVMVDDFMAEMDNFSSRKDVAKFIKKYRKMMHLEMIMVNYAEELINKKKHDTAMLIYLELVDNKYIEYISDEVTVWFRLGEYYINNGDIERGKGYLIQICNNYDNYEESFEFRALTKSWNKIKPYVEGEIKPSLVTNNNDDEIEPMTDAELLELFIEEMASGGIHAYLTNFGHRLDDTIGAAKRQEKALTIELLELIKDKYFDGKMPKTLDEIENRIYKNDWWFEQEYDEYYYRIELEYI